MNFPFYLAKRYLFSGSRQTAINWITWLSGVGVVLGCMSLFVVLSVFSGLRDFSLSFVQQLDPDFKATPISGKTLVITPNQENQLKQLDGIVAFSKVLEERVVFHFQEKDFIAYIKGVDANYTLVNQMEDQIELGAWLEPNSYEAVVGYGIANKLGMGIAQANQQFQARAVKPGKGSLDVFSNAFVSVDLLPVGVYFVNDEYHNKYVFTCATVAQELLQLKPNQFSGIEFKTNGAISQKNLEESLQKIFGNNLQLKNRNELNETLLRMLNTENLMLYLIFLLVLGLLLFTLIGTLFMMILDKQTDLNTFRSFGITLQQLQQVFMYQGVLICSIGGTLGLALGMVVVWIQWEYQPIMINDFMAYPVKFTIANIGIVLFTILLLGSLASYFASKKVSGKLLEK
jgi:lipoprotein-releasing system permease protein